MKINVGFPGLLFITFLVLKLTNVIQWSWWWVTCPLWLPFGVFIVIAGIFVVLALIFGRNFSKKWEGRFGKVSASCKVNN